MRLCHRELSRGQVLLTEARYVSLLQKMGLHEEAARLEEHVQAVRA